MISSGTTAIATSSADAVTLIPDLPGNYQHLVIINGGAAAGFFSTDGGTTWCRLTVGATVLDGCVVNVDVLVKRDGGTDVTGLYAYAY